MNQLEKKQKIQHEYETANIKQICSQISVFLKDKSADKANLTALLLIKEDGWYFFTSVISQIGFITVKLPPTLFDKYEGFNSYVLNMNAFSIQLNRFKDAENVCFKFSDEKLELSTIGGRRIKGEMNFIADEREFMDASEFFENYSTKPFIANSEWNKAYNNIKALGPDTFSIQPNADKNLTITAKFSNGAPSHANNAQFEIEIDAHEKRFDNNHSETYVIEVLPFLSDFKGDIQCYIPHEPDMALIFHWKGNDDVEFTFAVGAKSD